MPDQLRSIAVAHRQAVLDAQEDISSAHLTEAYLKNLKMAPKGIYTDTDERAKWRRLFQAAGQLPDTLMVVTCVKAAGEARVMMCQALPSEDYTKKYARVWDIESGDYRRVNLDGIVKVTLETHAAGSISLGIQRE